MLRVRERPLHVMDKTIAVHMGQGFDGLVDRTVQLANTVRAYRGTINVLWHNKNIISRRQRQLLRVLSEAISP